MSDEFSLANEDSGPGATAGDGGHASRHPSFGALPTLKSPAETEFLRQSTPPASIKIVPEAMAYTKALPKLPAVQLQTTLNAAFQTIWSGQRSPAAAMADVEGPMNQLLRG